MPNSRAWDQWDRWTITEKGKHDLIVTPQCHCNPRLAGLLIECPQCGTVYGSLRDSLNYGSANRGEARLMGMLWDKATYGAPDVEKFSLVLQQWLAIRDEETAEWAMVISCGATGYHVYGIGPNAPDFERILKSLREVVAQMES